MRQIPVFHLVTRVGRRSVLAGSIAALVCLIAVAANAAKVSGDSVTGGAYFGDPAKHLSIDAHSGANGEGASGDFSYKFETETTHGYGFATVQGPVTSLQVTGSQATVTGTITQESPKGFGSVGETVQFFIQDGGLKGPDFVNGLPTLSGQFVVIDG
jgi:hypothetical protein